MIRCKYFSCSPLLIQKKGGFVAFGLLSFFLLLTVGFYSIAEAKEKMVFGVVERVLFLPENVKVSAKLDTGAKTSSLGVTDMKIVTEDHHKWVYFAVNVKKMDKVYFKRKLEGYSKIKIRQSEKDAGLSTKDYISRPVVLMEIRLGDRQSLVSVNLANRQNFVYTFLLGRDAITQLGGIIDPAQHYTQKTLKKKTKSE
jgi:hypothetical protein